MTVFRVPVKQYEATTEPCPVCYSVAHQPCRSYKVVGVKVRLGGIRQKVHCGRRGKRYILGQSPPRQRRTGTAAPIPGEQVGVGEVMHRCGVCTLMIMQGVPVGAYGSAEVHAKCARKPGLGKQGRKPGKRKVRREPG